MQHGLHNTFDLVRVERGLQDSALKYHYLVADPRVRVAHLSRRNRLSDSLRSLLAPRSVLREERGI